MKKHRPSHIFCDNQIYFLTGRTYGKIPHLAGDEAKNIFKNSLFEKTKKFGFKLYAWTIMDNHYHILIDENLDGRGVNSANSRENGVANFSSRQNQRGVNSATPSSNIPKFIGELHGITSFKIKKIPTRQILNEEQIAYRKQTPMEDRIEKRLEEIVFEWERGLKPATPKEGGIADFSLRQEEGRAVNSATPRENGIADLLSAPKSARTKLRYSRPRRRLKLTNSRENGIANFSSHFPPRPFFC